MSIITAKTSSLSDLKFTLSAILVFFIIGLFTPVILPLTDSQASAIKSFYFFYPDSTQSNLSQVKSEVDSFFKQSDFNVRFQPFSHIKDFNLQITQSKPSFIFIPEWYYQQNKSSLGLKPILRPQRNGSGLYTKVLISQKQSVVNIDNLANHTLAMTTEGDSESSTLTQMLSNYQESSPKDINIINTAKDADAMFAVALGQVDVALVAKSTMEALAKINKRLTKNVKILAESAPIALPVLCYIEGSVTPSDVEKLRHIISEGHGQAKLKNMFQIDGWANVN
ncbi:MAG: PhnD/SsuA/transferrin family substrate-binding protein [Gammaproteobacteria bacterium]|nr:PhnD/SsuA/transferrin family substrate-binding protein [Gammaproteobacteria bacterium]